MASSFPFGLVRKLRNKQPLLEALFLGQAGLLEKEFEVPYYNELQANYIFLRTKYKLSNDGVIPGRFFRLRPDNFPYLRLSQLASLYHRRPRFFSDVIAASRISELEELFRFDLPQFWRTHYTFEKEHSLRKKTISRNFFELQVINSLIPIKFCYARSMGTDKHEELLDLVQGLKAESNSIISRFNKIRGRDFGNALESQALLHMKHKYCEKHRCLQCSLGLRVLQREA